MIFIKDEKFRSVVLSFHFMERVDERLLSYRYLLLKTLSNYSNSYPTKKKFLDKLGYLYGASLSSSVNIFSDYHVINLSITFPNPSILDDKTLIDEIINITNDILFDRTSFSNKDLKECKLELMEHIKSLKEHKMSYAQSRFFHHAFKGNALSFPFYGTINDIDEITSDNLYSYYKNSFLNNKCHIVLSGNLDDTDKMKFFNAFDAHSSDDVKATYNQVTLKSEETIVEVDETITQALIIMRCVLKIERNNPLFYAAVCASMILGGYPNSRLFKVIREEYNLAYEVEAYFDHTKESLFVFAAVDQDSKDLATNLIRETINDLVDNGPTNSEISEAISYLKNDLIKDLDNQSTEVYKSFTKSLYDVKTNFDQMLEQFSLITISDVKDALSYLFYHTTFILTGDGKNEDEIF